MTEGVKYDTGKLRWSIFPWVGAEEIMKVIEFGAKKYTPSNWFKVLAEPFGEERYLDAAQRHMVLYFIGEFVDKESRLSHLAHAGCCLLFLLSGKGPNPPGWWDPTKVEEPVFCSVGESYVPGSQSIS
jgi:hypothetical protein